MSTAIIQPSDVCDFEDKHISYVHQTTEDDPPSKYKEISNNMTLHQACEEGKLCLVKFILLSGLENINHQDSNGATPVMAAARKGQIAVFNFLVSQGCDLSIVDDFRSNILHSACEGGSPYIVRKLIESGKCNFESRRQYGFTPVMVAVKFGHIKVFDLLVRKGCNLKVVTNYKQNILHIACYAGHIDMVKHILSKGITRIDSKEYVGRTPVMLAAMHGHKDIVDFLVSKGCNWKTVDKEKDNMLHLACVGGHLDMVKHILSKGMAGIDSKGFFGRTAVLTAAFYGHKDIVDFLFSEGCNRKAVDKDKHNTLHLACISGQLDIVKYILLTGTSAIDSKSNLWRTPLMLAVNQGHKDIVDFLVSKGCNLKLVDEENNNILHFACLGGHVDMVKYLIKQKTVNGMEKARNKYHKTPVQVAEAFKHAKVVSFLTNHRCA